MTEHREEIINNLVEFAIVWGAPPPSSPEKQIARIRKSIDLKTRQLEYEHPTPKILKILRNARSDFQTLIRLAKKYPDLHLSTRPFEDELNSIEAAYDKLKRTTRRRR